MPASQVSVTVENGTGRSGLAGQVTQALRQGGFQTSAPANAGVRPAASEVHYAPGSVDSARTVAAAVPGAILKEDSTVSSGVVLILGANYTTVVPVTTSSSVAIPTSAPVTQAAPSASQTTPPVTAASSGNRCTY